MNKPAEGAQSFTVQIGDAPPEQIPSVEQLRYRPVPWAGCCPAITKKGTICGRTVVLGNGRCRSNGHGGENRPEDIAAMLAALQARVDYRKAKALRRARRVAKARGRYV